MTGPMQVAAGIDEVKENADRLGLSWTLRPGTIAAGTLPGSNACAVIMDGDTSPIPAFSMVGTVSGGLRVYVLRVQPEGTYIAGFSGPQQGVAAVRVTTASQGVLSGGAPGTMPWTAADYDTSTFWDASASTNVVVPWPGVYDCKFEGAWQNTAGTGVRYMNICLNGVTMVAHRHPGIAGDFGEMDVAAEFECADDDIITFQVYQTSGGALNLIEASATVRYVGSVR